jgi:cell division protein FtsB
VSDGPRTSTIPRPSAKPVAARRGERLADDLASGERRRGVLDDLSRPLPRDRQLVTRRANRTLLTLLALGVVVAFAAALFVLPVKAFFHQGDALSKRRHELDVLTTANDELAAEVNRLQTPAGIEEAAREEIGYIARGEQRVSVLPAPQAPVTLPGGWPYDAVSQIVAVRAAPPAAAATPTP